MQAEIISIGTEILLGEIVDTNSAWIARQLRNIGLNLYYTGAVGDNLVRVAEVLANALRRSDVVITTGGLGPTVDDVTREAAAKATGRGLVLDEGLLEEIRCHFARRQNPMTENNRKQALLPEGAMVIHNPVGTAPAFAIEHEGHLLICLPGVPHEMRYLVEHEVIPLLKARFGLTGVIKTRTLRTCGLGESAIDSLIGDLMRLSNPTVGTAAHPGQTDVRITAKGSSESEVAALIAPIEQELRRRLGDYIFGVDQETLGGVVGRLLSEKGLRLAVAETITAGDISRAIMGQSEGQAARALAGGVLAPTHQSLISVFSLNDDQGEISQTLCDGCAEAIRKMWAADLGLAVLGPVDPNSEEAPLTYFALAGSSGIRHLAPTPRRADPSGLGWLVHLGLDLVRRQLLGLGEP